ncbi:restriction endonuclease subunit S [Clostridium faecium]|uniref:Restriction endonuclease subunit S n=1 Tax=Clostridium faecium TaxID=2762223 RepID=A0ABR8YR66_9CLOT|nr:restriction endonuclease subunit S [Clostridium faecium]MBD8046714.1 restriction endonuclease subunit S [Clostridium faecium]
MLVKYKLCELGDIFTGNTPSKKNSEFYDSKDIMFIKPDDINNNITEIKSSKEYISNKAEKKARIVPKDSLLITCIGSIGKIAINKKESAFNQQINSIVHNEKIISSKYLAYVFKVNKQRLEAISNAPVVPIINKTQFSEFEVYIHEKKEIQQKIVYILDRAQSLIDKRKTQIEALDELVKSRFIEMFGDPVLNTKNWDMKTLSEVGSLGRGVSKHRPRNAPELLGGDYPLIQTGDVANAVLYIKEYNSTYSELGLKQSKLWEKGTLCITIAANIAKTGILTFDACFPDSVVGFVAGDKTNNIFMYYWFSLFQKLLEDQAPESAQKNINLKILGGLKVIVPPIELQNQFADFVKQVDKLKFEMEKSLKELEDNFNSLMQRAFKGELFN